MLKVLLLGPPTILYDDQPLKIQRRQLRTLLFFLACHQTGIGREELVTKFWPEKNESTGRKHLREILSKLRTQLPDPEILQTDTDRIRLNKNLIYSDIFEYRKLVQPVLQYFGNAQTKPVLPDVLVSRLEQAVKLWRAPNFWSDSRSGVSRDLDNWFQETAAAIELDFVQNLERLSHHYAGLNELDQAIFYSQNALKTDPQNEEIQEQLLSWLYKAGRISEAQSFYSYLTNLYQREYDDKPPETIDRAKNKASQFDLEEQKQIDNAWRLKPFTTSHFVGRQKELEILKTRYSRGDVVVLTGESGAGKTRLAQQFFNTLDKKPRLLMASCSSMESDLPLQPLIDMLRNYIRTDDWAELSPQWQKVLSVLVPDFVKEPNFGHNPTYSSSEHALTSVFESIRQLFLAISRKSRIMFVLDDAHWSDLRTLKAVSYLIERNFFFDHGLCIVTTRPEIPNPAIREWWLSIEKRLPITRISVPMFNEDEVTEIVRHTIRQIPNRAFIQRIFTATNGNPMFILETLNALLTSTEDPSNIQEKEDFPIANNISTVLLEKERYCSEKARNILAIAAICGMEFNMDVLELTENISSDELVGYLEELEAQQLIKSAQQTSSPGRFSFVHSLIRDAVLSRLSQSRQCLLHNQVALAMTESQSHAAKQQAAIIARHFEDGGRPLPAFRHWLIAGQYARSLFAIPEAMAAYRKAHNIRVRIESALSEEDIYNLYAQWGDLAFTLMDLETLMECYTAMHAAGEQKKSNLLIGAGLSGLAISTALRLEIDRSLVLFEESIQVLNRTDNLFEKITAFNRMGTTLWFALQFEKANDMYRKSIDLGKDFQNTEIRQAVARAQYQLSFSYSLMGWPNKAKDVGLQSLKNAYLLVSNPVHLAEAHFGLALAALFTDSYEECMEHCREGLHISEQLQSHRTSTLIKLIQARISLSYGKLNEAWNLAHKGLRIAEDNSYFESIAEAHCVLGDIYQVLHNYPLAIQEYTAGAQEQLETFWGMNCYLRLGFITAKTGDFDHGLQILDRAISFTSEVGFEGLCLSAQLLRAVLLEQAGNTLEAEEIFVNAEKEMDRRSLQNLMKIRDYYRAAVQYESGKKGEIEQSNEILEKRLEKYPNIWLALMQKQIKTKILDRQLSENEMNGLLDEMGEKFESEELRGLFTNFRNYVVTNTTLLPL